MKVGPIQRFVTAFVLCSLAIRAAMFFHGSFGAHSKIPSKCAAKPDCNVSPLPGGQQPVVPLWYVCVRARSASLWHPRLFAPTSFRAQRSASSAIPSKVPNPVPAASNVVGKSASVGTPPARMPGDSNHSAQASRQLRTLKAFWSALGKSLHSLLPRNSDVVLLLERAGARARTAQLKRLAANVRDAGQTKFNALTSVAPKVLARLGKLMSATVAPKVGGLSQLMKQRIRKSRNALSSTATAKGTYLQQAKCIRTKLGSSLPPVKGTASDLLHLAKHAVSKVRNATAKKIGNGAKCTSSKLCNALVKTKIAMQQTKKHCAKSLDFVSSAAQDKLYDGRQLLSNKWAQLLTESKEFAKCTQFKMRLVAKILQAPTETLRTNPESLFYTQYVIGEERLSAEQNVPRTSGQVASVWSTVLIVCVCLSGAGRILIQLSHVLVQQIAFLGKRPSDVAVNQFVTPQLDKPACPFELCCPESGVVLTIVEGWDLEVYDWDDEKLYGYAGVCTSLIRYQPAQTIADLLPRATVCLPSIHPLKFALRINREMFLNMLEEAMHDLACSMARADSRREEMLASLQQSQSRALIKLGSCAWVNIPLAPTKSF